MNRMVINEVERLSIQNVTILKRKSIFLDGGIQKVDYHKSFDDPIDGEIHLEK